MDAAVRRVDRDIVGKPIVLGGDSYIVVGVLPPDFRVPGMTPRDYFVPINLDAAMADVNRARKFHYLHGFGRLKDGVTLEAAQAELTSVAHGIERENPGVSDGHLTTVLPLADAIVGGVRPTILALMGAAGFVLLIAAANLANLALGARLLRRREFAVRAALGASRARSGARGAHGKRVAVARRRRDRRGDRVAWDAGALVAVSERDSGVVSCARERRGARVRARSRRSHRHRVRLGAAHRGVRRERLTASLGDGSRGSSAGRPQTRARNALVVAQIALAIVLVVGAGLLVQTLYAAAVDRSRVRAEERQLRVGEPHRAALSRDAADHGLLADGADATCASEPAHRVGRARGLACRRPAGRARRSRSRDVRTRRRCPRSATACFRTGVLEDTRRADRRRPRLQRARYARTARASC